MYFISFFVVMKINKLTPHAQWPTRIIMNPVSDLGKSTSIGICMAYANICHKRELNLRALAQQ